MNDPRTTFKIRHAVTSDVPRMLEIYSFARAFMAEHGNPRQWGMTGWPPREVLEKDVAAGKSYVCEAEGRVAGTFYFDAGPHVERSYDDITDGAWLGEKKYGEAGNTYGVVHRLASDGSVKGVGTFCLDYAYDQSRHLRVDTHPDNAVMQALLEKLGFVRCGIVHAAEDDDPRIAYEKV